MAGEGVAVQPGKLLEGGRGGHVMTDEVFRQEAHAASVPSITGPARTLPVDRLAAPVRGVRRDDRPDVRVRLGGREPPNLDNNRPGSTLRAYAHG
jgi:hypothetical protein